MHIKQTHTHIHKQIKYFNIIKRFLNFLKIKQQEKKADKIKRKFKETKLFSYSNIIKLLRVSFTSFTHFLLTLFSFYGKERNEKKGREGRSFEKSQ